MLERIKGILLLLPLILAFFFGNIVFSLSCIVLGCVSFLELSKAFKEKQIHLSIGSSIILIVFLLLNIFLSVNWKFIVVALFFFFAITFIFQKKTIEDISINIFALLYCFVPFLMLSELYKEDIYFSVLVFIISFSSDIFAYICGKLFGKHKLIPQISPNKTIEGSIGAIIGTLLVTILCAYLMNILKFKMIPIGLFGSVVAQIGDLFASAIKRYCGIKDFSKLIPGHGGILDRFDSVIFVTLLIYSLLI